jgi:hypothetical protein
MGKLWPHQGVIFLCRIDAYVLSRGSSQACQFWNASSTHIGTTFVFKYSYVRFMPVAYVKVIQMVPGLTLPSIHFGRMPSPVKTIAGLFFQAAGHLGYPIALFAHRMHDPSFLPSSPGPGLARSKR